MTRLILATFFSIVFSMSSMTANARGDYSNMPVGGSYCTIAGFTSLQSLFEGMNELKRGGAEILSVTTNPKDDTLKTNPNLRCAPTDFPEGTFLVMHCNKPYQLSEGRRSDDRMDDMQSAQTMDGKITPCGD